MEEVLEIVRNTADGVYVVDEQQRILFWNESAEDLLGYTAEEVVGELCYKILAGRDEEDYPVCRHDCRPLAACGRGELVPNFDARVRRKDGQPRWVNISIIAIPGSSGRPRGVIHLFRDISTKKRAETFAAEVAAQVQRLRLHRPVTATATDNGSTFEELTPREFQVLELLAGGADTTTIATELVISEATVRNHVQHILHKLGVHSRLEAVAYAREHSII